MALAARLAMGLVLALAAGLPGLAAPAGVPVIRIEEGGQISAPAGFLVFCLKSPADCRAGGPEWAEDSPSLRAKLAATNRAVNRSIRPQNDVRDVWMAEPATGDCEDYALTKRARLVAAGVPAGALRLATARTAAGQAHAVLVVRTSGGDLVLDNLTDAILEWHQSGLDWVALSTADPRRWVRITGHRPPV